MFKDERKSSGFEWSMLGDVTVGRPNLGPLTHVAVYRLMQFTLRDTLIREFGVAATDRVFYEAGKTAGAHFFQNLVTKRGELNEFVGNVQELLKTLGVGLLRVEKADPERLAFTMTVAEDLDCSGLPVCGEQICTYDEGFIAGLMGAYAHREFVVKEVDCWCSGDRVCRLDVRLVV